MNEWFIKSGYLESAIEKEMKNLRFSKQGQNSKRSIIFCNLSPTT